MKPLGPTDPQRVGQYRLLGKLGAGGMGSVYLARSDRGRTVAVKLVQPELAAQPEFRQRFQHEVEAARRVGGEWTAPVLDADTLAETPWVATGYVAGPSLHDVVANSYGPLPERTLFILANGLVKALRDIHGAGLVHRDLKPSNVMITIDGPRVIDFGIARALESGEGLTRTGAAVGSPGFMSPEQCRGETLTPASDIFCLGSVLTFAATGRTPFGDANSAMTALMLAIVQGQHDLSAVPEGIRPLIESCLAQNPTERPTLDQLHQFTDLPADGEEPWLPGALVARLGRHAVELLDSEDPMQAPPLPSNQPPPAMPPGPPVTPLPPGAQPTPTTFAPGTPPPSPVPPSNTGVNAMATMTSAVPPPGYPQPQPPGTPAYGYPQQGGTPAYGYPQHHDMGGSPYGPGGYPGGPGGPGGPAKRNNTVWIVVAAIVAVAIVAGASIFAFSGGDSEDEADGDNDRTTSQGPTGEDGQNEEQPSREGTDDGDSTAPDPNAVVPPGYAGAWVGEVTGGNGDPFMLRVEISEGSAGQQVATEYSLLDSVMCVEGATLVSSNGGMVVNGSGVTTTFPSGSTCNPFGEQTLTMQGTTMRWESGNWSAELNPSTQDPGSDGMSYAVYSSTYSNSELLIDPETTASPGETAFLISARDGSCTWSSPMMNGGLQESTIYVGPGDVTSGDCDPLPSYRISWTASGSSDAAQISFFRLGSNEAEFTAQNDDL
ncbi:serine/threonine-protein kinase [Streptomyces millisiae]|uniref:Serine/threonine-protein kinase n=1 Tax=Streptomyces millisiae TaxID=3075542 RepID=A0ABU2M279_9ACTN|nr:serine/threonine-protein kinase [Streptomyces sp. DSM 44918]MDT0323368.1 serine/threonine-protein kinase [Streptomyces sp. DSM 44918]